MAILDELKSYCRFIVIVILFLAVSDVEKVPKTYHPKTTVEYSINKAPRLAQEAKKVYIYRDMIDLPPWEWVHTSESSPAKLSPDYISFGIQTSQGGLSSPSYGVQPDNLATCSAPAKHAYTLTGYLNIFISPILQALIIIAAVFLPAVLFHKLTCYIKNKMEKICKPFSYIQCSVGACSDVYWVKTCEQARTLHKEKIYLEYGFCQVNQN